jgi:hypothetical protein
MDAMFKNISLGKQSCFYELSLISALDKRFLRKIKKKAMEHVFLKGRVLRQ